MSSAHVSWLQWPGLTNKFRQINTGSRDGWNCVKFCTLKSVPHSTLARAIGTAFWLVDNWPLDLRGIYITSGNAFFSSIENFSTSQPSLARLYSAAASPFERLRSDGSLAIRVKHCLLQIRVKHCLYWLGLSIVLKLVRFFFGVAVAVDAICT